MKVYSWKTLLAVIFIGGPLLVHNVMQIREEFFSGIVMTVIALYLIVKGLYVSFTEEGYKEDQENGVRGKRVFRKLFGRFAPIMPYSVLLLFGLLAVIVSVTEISLSITKSPSLIFSVINLNSSCFCSASFICLSIVFFCADIFLRSGVNSS